MIGIGIDGQQVMYLRYSASENRARYFQPVSLETQLEFFRPRGFGRGGFQIVRPMPIDEPSMDWLLYSLRFFHRRALEPHGLAEVFGPEAPVASRAVNALYHKLVTTPSARVQMFFKQWDMIFGIIYGQEFDRGDTAAKELAKLYGITDRPRLKTLLFAVHTYYVLLMKMLAAELISLQEGSWFQSFAGDIEAASDDLLKSRLENLEDGGLFKQFHIVNFLEGDFFRWYLDTWDGNVAQSIRHLAIALQQFEPATATIDPDATRDLLKKLYQYLLPRRVRHDLGEYYTPDWLAERLIRQIGYDGDPNKRVLDPSCGSGTFLSLCIRRAFEYADRYLVRPEELAQKLLTNVVGFDLNPLAVIAARTNFLLSLGTLIKKASHIEIPVYFCDSILTPAEFSKQGELKLGARDSQVETFEGINQFAPIFVGKNTFDFVIGNPPWVNWQSLSDSYREKTWRLWEDYGLFSLGGDAGRRGAGKKDLAMLFTYACLDNYVRPGGRLGFIITQTLFKSKGAGDGFRRFRFGERGSHFQTLQVDDLSDFQPFEGATNRTAVVTFEKGKPTIYPVQYSCWRKKPGESIGSDDDLTDIHPGKVEVKNWRARPINPADPHSPWLTARPKALDALQKAVGRSEYRAYAGSCTWANGVYWLEIMGENNSGQVIVRNLSDIGKLEGIEQVAGKAMEPDLLYPLLRGRGVGRWRTQTSAYLLNVQDPQKRQGYEEAWLKDTFPETYKYLLTFETLLSQRSGFKKYFCKEVGTGKHKRLEPVAPFYSLYNIGDYTLAPYKVCWREQAQFLTCAVASNSKVAGKTKVVIPDHKLMFVPLDNIEEAHYVCAALSSSVAVLLVKSYGVETQTSTHVLEYVRLPKFDANDKRHCRLAALSTEAHKLAAQGELARKQLEGVEAEIDQEAAPAWGVNVAELRDIQSSLADLR